MEDLIVLIVSIQLQTHDPHLFASVSGICEKKLFGNEGCGTPFTHVAFSSLFFLFEILALLFHHLQCAAVTGQFKRG